MNRRKFMLVAGATGLVGTSGCLTSALPGDNNSGGGTVTDDSSNSEPTVDGEEPELTPGAETTLTVTANNITDLHFSELPDREVIEFDLDSDHVSPAPEAIDQSYPPHWSWSSRTSVTVDAPVTVADDAEPGEYPYEVTVLTDNDKSTEMAEEFVITVVED